MTRSLTATRALRKVASQPIKTAAITRATAAARASAGRGIVNCPKSLDSNEISSPLNPMPMMALNKPTRLVSINIICRTRLDFEPNGFEDADLAAALERRQGDCIGHDNGCSEKGKQCHDSWNGGELIDQATDEAVEELHVDGEGENDGGQFRQSAIKLVIGHLVAIQFECPD